MQDHPQLAPPAPPRAVRISRRALWAMLAVVAVTVLGASLALNQKTSAAGEKTRPAPPPPVESATPSFLEREPLAPPPQSIAGAPVPLGTPEELRRAHEAGFIDDYLPRAEAGFELDLPPSEDLTGLPTPPAPPDARAQAFERARAASSLVRGAPAPQGVPDDEPTRVARQLGLTGTSDPLLAQLPSVRELLAGPPAANVPGATSPAETSAPPRGAATGAHRLSFEAPGRYTLPAGATIPVVLETGIHSDLAGDVVAQVTLDVYDHSRRDLLIPRGSRLLGAYENRLGAGQSRLLIAWTRLVLPNGRSAALPGLAAAGPGGETGVSGHVNNHFARVFGHAVLLSLVSAGAQLGQPQESATFGQAASNRQVAAGALAQELSGVATEILRRGLSRPPTITVPPGTSFHVYVSADLVFPEPYRS